MTQFFNIWSILACTAIFMILGALWYSPLLFSKIWMRVNNFSKEDLSKKKANIAMIVSVVAILIVNVLMRIVIYFMGTTMIKDYVESEIVIGLIVGLIIGAIYFFTTMINYSYQQKSFKALIINTSFLVLYFIIAGIILTIW